MTIFFLQPGDPEYKKFMGRDELVKKRKKTLRLFEDTKPEDISFAEVNKKRNEIMNKITSISTVEFTKQKISLSKFCKGQNGAMSNQTSANAIMQGEYLI